VTVELEAETSDPVANVTNEAPTPAASIRLTMRITSRPRRVKRTSFEEVALARVATPDGEKTPEIIGETGRRSGSVALVRTDFRAETGRTMIIVAIS
jgi:hypothetical protein